MDPDSPDPLAGRGQSHGRDLGFKGIPFFQLSFQGCNPGVGILQLQVHPVEVQGGTVQVGVEMVTGVWTWCVACCWSERRMTVCLGIVVEW